MRLNLELINSDTNATVKRTTIKLPDRSSRMSMVMLAKKWAHLSGVPSTTVIKGVNDYIVRIPSADKIIKMDKDSLDEVYTDKMLLNENGLYVWYVPEFSYGTKAKGKVDSMKGVWR
jgi:hypothetical protein